MEKEKKVQAAVGTECAAYVSPSIEVITIETQGLIAGSVLDIPESDW